jgi:hypothetical protein
MLLLLFTIVPLALAFGPPRARSLVFDFELFTVVVLDQSEAGAAPAFDAAAQTNKVLHRTGIVLRKRMACLLRRHEPMDDDTPVAGV